MFYVTTTTGEKIEGLLPIAAKHRDALSHRLWLIVESIHSHDTPRATHHNPMPWATVYDWLDKMNWMITEDPPNPSRGTER